MKHMLLSALVILTTIFAQAKIVNSEDLKVSASSIDQVIRLVDKDDPGSSHKKLSIIVEDHGMSTDVSPRYTISLGYASMAEMGNITADFKITDQAYKFISAKRKGAGIYEVKTKEYRDADGMYDVTLTIDATKMFVDEKEQRKACGDNFCDLVLKTSISVSEKATKQK
ncbi:MAG: hypothetical protein V4654_15545 [Bdellovibrionota bacterium]